MKFLEQFYIQFYSYNNELISEHCAGERNPLYQVRPSFMSRWYLTPKTVCTAPDHSSYFSTVLTIDKHFTDPSNSLECTYNYCSASYIP